MKKRITPVTFHYMLITGGFWMAFCVVSAYAAVYLQGLGYSNAELGIIMAAGNIGGAVLSPVLGARIDRNRSIRHAWVIYALLGIQAALLILLRTHPQKDRLSSVCYALYMATLLPVNAMNLDLCVRLEHAGAPLDFGTARSVGSFAFMVLSILLGILTERLTYTVLPLAGLAVIALQAFSNAIIDRDLREAEKNSAVQETEKTERSASMLSFIRENKAFCVMLLGTVLIFTAHNTDGNFLINEIRNLGGDTAVMGYVAAFQAIVEVPVMIFASRLPKSWGLDRYIRLSFLFFVIKILSYALAPNIPLFFAARVFQAPSYALYTVLTVPYIDLVVPHKDSAKAQSFAFSMTNVGSVLASLAGGALFDACGVRDTMLIATGIAAAGAVIASAGTLRKKG